MVLAVLGRQCDLCVHYSVCGHIRVEPRVAGQGHAELHEEDADVGLATNIFFQLEAIPLLWSPPKPSVKG